jgi:hypothetical protein
MDATESPKEGSAFGRMLNVLAAPSEVFTEIKERPVEHSNWIVPAITWAIAAMTMVFVLFSQDWAMREMRKMQDKAIETALDKNVAKGKMPRAQADKQKEITQQMMDRYGPMFVKVGGSVGALVGAFVVPFLWGFLIWFLGVKVFKADFEYMKAVEAAALGMIIYVVAATVSTLTAFAVGRLASVSPAFFLPDFDMTNKSHMALAAINPFYIWYAVVAAIATSVFSGASLGKAVAWVFAIWIGLRAVMIALNMGQFAM